MSTPQVGGDFGRYHLDRLLGRGGMGMVFEAVDTTLNRPVALKIILPSLADIGAYRDRFSREAATLARIRSRHIVQIHEYGEQDGNVYLVTELFPDGDLAHWMSKHGPLSTERALTLTAQVCEGLQDAHDAGVIHRDIKPSNVLLWERNHQLIPYLCDFGIAGGEDGGLTRSGALMGSLAYMAPERNLGHPADEAGDIYSAGCLLWATLTGAPPYGGTDYQLMESHLNDPIPSLAAADPLAGRTNDILRTAMAKHAGQRFATAADFRDALLDALSETHVRRPAPAPIDRPVEEVTGYDSHEQVSPDRTPGPDEDPPPGTAYDSPFTPEPTPQPQLRAPGGPMSGYVPLLPAAGSVASSPPPPTPGDHQATPRHPEADGHPPASTTSSRPRWLWPVVGVGVLGLAIVLVVLYLNRSSPTLHVPTVAAKPGYRAVTFSARPPAGVQGVRTEFKVDGDWRATLTHRVQVEQGGDQACIDVRTHGVGKSSAYSETVHKCAKAQPRSVTVVSLGFHKNVPNDQTKCPHGCYQYDARVRGFEPGKSVVAHMLLNGKDLCGPGCTYAIRPGSAGTGHMTTFKFDAPTKPVGTMVAVVDGVRSPPYQAK